MRIWRGLHPDPKRSNLGLIENVLQYDSLRDKECDLCSYEESSNTWKPLVLSLIRSSQLDESQKNAVLSSISMVKCSHQQNNVKLIWGPPGTGKIKTIASLLFVLLRLRCRTLTCAPTNVAVLQVAEKLVTLFLCSIRQYDTYGLGDILLFGNEDRMKIDDHPVLEDVFFSYREAILEECYSPFKGWSYNLKLMVELLKNPLEKYDDYLKECDQVDSDPEERKDRIRGSKEGYFEKEAKNEGNIMSFEEFLIKTFQSIAHRLIFCGKNLYTHLPTSFLHFRVAKDIFEVIDMLKSNLDTASKQTYKQFTDLMVKRDDIRVMLESLVDRVPYPKKEMMSIRKMCMDGARLIFCTASGAIKVRKPVEMVIIDEAAQLKECESAIALQIPGRNAILVGDDRQLPAMVQSRVLEDMDFGRSLFQRLSTLGKKKHLLNIQYRMHPSISTFPNMKFYDNSIIDAPNVNLKHYTKSFLRGDIYGSYSFINVPTGYERFKQGHSPSNVEEAKVVQRIVGKLYKYHCVTNRAFSVGVISPYKAQVGLIQEKLVEKYSHRKDGGFSVSVRSVDGFQGGEEDIIIISTVRCNNSGSVGFLSNHQRTNVALTRARYCLWIVGNASTLTNSGTVWQDFVNDATTRGCFYNADEDIDLKQVLSTTSISSSKLIESTNLVNTRWKLILTNAFKKSLGSVKRYETQRQVMDLLKKIAEGWRHSEFQNAFKVPNQGVSSELLEYYKVDEQLYLAWSTDIESKESKQTQVIKVWNILPASELPKLAKNLDFLFGRYTVDIMNRCKYKLFERNLVLPMSWPLNSATFLPDLAEYLSSHVAKISNKR